MKSRVRLSLRTKDHFYAYSFFLPVFIVLSAFLIWPTINIMILSLTDSSLLRPNKPLTFIGLQNFSRLYGEREFVLILIRSVIFTFSATVLSLLISYLIAVLINYEFRGKGIVTALFFLPWVISDVVTSFVFKWNFDLMYGVINYILYDVLGIIPIPLAWLGNRYTALPAVMLANIWRLLPFSTLTLIAALKQIPQGIIDSARVDGASALNLHTRIIIPYLRAPLSVLITLRIGALFRSFDITWLLTKGGPGYTTTTLPIYYYKAAFEGMDVGKCSAIAVHIFLFVFVVYFFIYRVIGKEAFN